MDRINRRMLVGHTLGELLEMWMTIWSMLGLAEQDGDGARSAYHQRRCLMVDGLAYPAVRILIFFHNRTSLIEWLQGGAGRSQLGRINLSLKQQLDGWRVATDEAGYNYAYQE